MAVLTDEVKEAIVRALACFDTPTQAAETVAQDFGIRIDRSQVAKYDPTKSPGARLSPKWRAVFEATRAAFLDQVGDIPIAQQSFRLRNIQRMYHRVLAQGNTALAASLLEQAAKEVGGMFSNRRELTGRDGAPLVPDPALNPTVIVLTSPTKNADGTWDFTSRTGNGAVVDV